MDYYRSATHKLRTALGLSRRDWGIFITAWLRLWIMDGMLRSRPYPHVQQFVEKHLKEQVADPNVPAWETIRRGQELVQLAARYQFPRKTCLRQALTLKWLLAERGLPTGLRFGVRKADEQFQAHAWLEYEGQAIELSHSSEPYLPLKSTQEGR